MTQAAKKCQMGLNLDFFATHWVSGSEKHLACKCKPQKKVMETSLFHEGGSKGGKVEGFQNEK